MSAGGESSSEQLPTSSPHIIAHEEDLAWQEYDALDTARHGATATRGTRDYSAAQHAPTALSIMRRDRSGSEDVLTARKALLERREERMGEGDINMSSRFPRLTPGMPYSSVEGGRINPPSVMLHRHPAEYMADRARWEQEQAYGNSEYHQYYYEDDPYYGNYGYGFRDYGRGGASSQLGNHAPMPSFLGDAYRRHQEMGYGAAQMSLMKDRYLLPVKGGGGYRDPISLSDHGPSGRGGGGTAPSNTNLNTPMRQVSQGSAPVQRVRSTQPVPTVSPQRGVVNNGRAYQEMDWKQDRLWREDNHTQTASLNVVNPVNQASGQTAGQAPMVRKVCPPALVSVTPRFTSQQVQDCPPPSSNSVFVKSSKVPPNPHPPAQSHRPAPKKSVSFNALQIRTYETILGDNPSCSTGPSLGLGWRYDPSHYISTIDEYERHQSQHGCADPRPEDLVLHRFEREAILLNTGYTRQDLAESVRGITKVKNRRRQTVHNLPVAWVEERMEGCRRTLRRWILNKNRTRSMYDEWKRQEMANMDARPSSCTRGILRKRRSG